MEAKYSIPFPVLSDPKGEVHKLYNVLLQLDDAEVERLSGFGIDLDAWSHEAEQSIAIPSLFLIGKDGKVRWVHTDPDHRTRPSIDQIFLLAADR